MFNKDVLTHKVKIPKEKRRGFTWFEARFFNSAQVMENVDRVLFHFSTIKMQ